MRLNIIPAGSIRSKTKSILELQWKETHRGLKSLTNTNNYNVHVPTLGSAITAEFADVDFKTP
jgi:hypothetical protein